MRMPSVPKTSGGVDGVLVPMPTLPPEIAKYAEPDEESAVVEANGNTLDAVAVEVMVPVLVCVPKLATPSALSTPAIVVDADIASEPLDVALPKSVLPASVVEARELLSVEDMGGEGWRASEPLDVALPNRVLPASVVEAR